MAGLLVGVFISSTRLNVRGQRTEHVRSGGTQRQGFLIYSDPGWREQVSIPKPAGLGELPDLKCWLKAFGYALKINYFIHQTMLYS